MSEPQFNHGEPLGYFITWTTYGTWLPGDDRGWHRKGEADIQIPSPLSAESAQSKMKETDFWMNQRDRQIVLETISRHCQIRNWELHAADARTNHVHVVVTAPFYSPEEVRDQLKAWCTRSLKPHYPGRKNFWTEGASRRFLNTQADLDTTVQYVKEAQDQKGCEYDLQSKFHCQSEAQTTESQQIPNIESE